MTIKYEEVEVKPLRQFSPTKCKCDVCGKDAFVARRGHGEVRNPWPASHFAHVVRNTEENPVSDTAMINDAVKIGVSDLCQKCAIKVCDFIRSLGADSGHSGMRKPDEYGN